MKHVFILVLLILIVFSGISQQKPVVLQASVNGRYLQWSDGKPFYIHACTAWTLCHDYSDQEVKDYLDSRVAGKFNTIQMSAVFAELVKTMADSAFSNQDLSRPVPKYW